MSAVELELEQLVTPALLVMELILWVGKLHLTAYVIHSQEGQKNYPTDKTKHSFATPNPLKKNTLLH
jgi:hypothetical protein